ncbi:hypothetical protein BDV98DRAFT_124052 [Pterulicium gracile]|uniref:Uncharacterized protein n=1 Tax=Pterulicium gracile TaxID=1884261 RepID=A0A5C3QI43_9AGAR|nr:hypothetical protein BDV98DRAFT_124052 [Pterula gracilis]
MSLLWSHSNRFEFFSFKEHGQAAPNFSKTWIEGQAYPGLMPHLKTLSLRLHSYRETPAELDAIGVFLALFTQYPFLTRLSLDGFPGCYTAPAAALVHGIPWQNLRQLAVTIHKLPFSSHT